MENKYKVNCISCKTQYDPEEEKRTIYKDDMMKVVLRVDNQCWLGRCIIVPFEHVSPKELYASRHDILLRISKIIQMLNLVFAQVYQMDMANIAQLGNLTEDGFGNKTAEDGYFHVHFHYIPRYKEGKTIRVLDHDFTDKQWGKALNIDPKAGLEVYKPNEEMIAQIRSDLSSAINNIIKK